MPCERYCLKRNKVKYYWARVLKNDTTIYEMDELVDHCLVSFEKFHKQYIIMPSLSFDPLLIEESSFVTVRSPPGFVNRENETRYYLNSTFQHLYLNVLFGELVFKIDRYTMLNGLKRESQHFVHNFQKIVILRELQIKFGEIYLGGKKAISTDMFFILANITTNFQMDASEF